MCQWSKAQMPHHAEVALRLPKALVAIHVPLAIVNYTVRKVFTP